MTTKIKLAERPQIIFAESDRSLRIRNAHRLCQLGLVMRTDPGDKQQAPQHDECWNLVFLFPAEIGDALISLQPCRNEVGNFRIMLIKGHWRGSIIHEPAEARIVEVDNFYGLAVDQKICKPKIAVNEAKALLALSTAFETVADERGGSGEQRQLA